MQKDIPLYSLTHIQRGILQSELLYPQLLTNNICTSLTYPEKLHAEYLKKAIRYIIENNEVLRTRIVRHDNQLLQTAANFSHRCIKSFDMSDCSDEEIEKHFTNYAQKKINVFAPQLYAFCIIKLPKNKTCIYLKFHHIISDSWSLFLFEKQLYASYQIFLKNKTPDFPPQSLSAYLKYENNYMQSPLFTSDSKYFLQSEVAVKSPFHDHYSKSLNAQRLCFTLTLKETQQLQDFCIQNKTSPFIVIISALSIWFSKTAGTDSFHILTPVRNRTNLAQKSSYGLFVNTLPFVIKTNKNTSFLEHIRKLKQAYLHFLKHSKYPNILVFEKIQPGQNLPSLFFSYENTSVKNNKVKVKHFYAGEDTTALSIHLSDRARSKRLLFEIDYRTAAFSSDLIKTMFESLRLILKQGQKDGAIPLNKMGVVPDAFMQKMSKGIHFKDAFAKPYNSPLELFKKQVQKNPNTDAVIYGNSRLSYTQLDALSEHIASIILSTDKKKKQIHVAVSMPKTEKLIVVFMAVFKAGGIFIPIEPDLPKARKQLMIDGVKPDILIEEKSSGVQSKGSHLFYKKLLHTKQIKNNLPQNKGKNLAVYFTSGTTGAPNAVYLSNEALVNLVWTWKKYYNLKPANSNVLQLANTGFDVFISDIAKSLFNGGKLILIDKSDRLNMAKLSEIIEAEKVCLFESTPALAIPLMKYLYKKSAPIKSLKNVIMGGDACTTGDLYELVNMYDNRIHFYNTYGVTEAGIETTVYKATANDQYNTSIAPLGYALPCRRVYILNDDLQLLPVGVKGIIYIGGTGVAQRYINNKKGSQKRFINNPFIKNEILYRTGDYGCLLKDGNIEFLGREDQQIKLKGYRIEPAEIETKIKEINGVAQGVVVYATKKNSLLAFVVKEKDSTLNDKHIFNHLKKCFPAYMLPEQILFIDNIPLTENAKIDRETLQNMGSIQINEVINKSKNKTELWLHKIWCNILKMPQISTHKSIFLYGADSIQVMLFVAALEKKGIRIAPQDVYDYPDISSLAQFITKALKKEQKEHNISLKNEPEYVTKAESRSVKGILLTGATGFLGIHLLKDLLNKNLNVICAVREKHGVSGILRLKEIWRCYHRTEWPSHAEIVSYKEGKISLIKAIESHSDKFTDVIHAAALVKQWGVYKTFEQANVVLTKDIIDFCILNKKYLHLISTTSVAALAEKQKGFNNPYIQTKSVSEDIFKVALTKGMKGSIYRTGNLTGRYSDGVFQKNIEENLTYQILKAIIKLSLIPENLIQYPIDMTPVDLCSQAIVEQIAVAKNVSVYTVAHKTGANNKTLLEALKENGFHIKVMANDLFWRELNNLSRKLKTGKVFQVHLLKYFLNEMAIHIQNTKQLNDLDTSFKWPELNKNYFLKIIKDCMNRKFF